MTSFKSLSHWFRTAIFLVLSCASIIPAHAQVNTTLTLGINQSEVISLNENFSHAVIQNRSIASVTKHNAHKISITGRRVGRTEIRLIDTKKETIRTYTVSVIQDFSSIKHSLHSLFPNENIGVEKVNNSVALTGTISTPEVAAQAIKIASQFVPEANIVNLMKLRTGQQVMLRVRVGELKRDVLGKLGLGLQGIISAGPTVLGSLERDQAFKTLAEPTLTAISGQSAQFLAGGEFPVPVSQSGAVSIDYKSFGVSVNFTPTVLSEKRLRLDVASEVSELSTIGAVKISSMNIPAIATRRANTTVELAPGESFMIAGLMRNDYNAKINEVPGLGDIPILNVLFRSAAFQRNETELVIAVTPYLVDPYEGQNVRLPTDNLQSPNTMDQMFTGTLGHYRNKQAETNDSLKFEGPTGFMID